MRPLLSCRCRVRGFTLVEVLVVIAIMSILLSILLPAVQGAREVARNVSCLNNLKQLGLALHNYHDVHRTFPAGGLSQPGRLPGAGISFFVSILPQLERSDLYLNLNTSVPGSGDVLQGPNGPVIHNVSLPVLRCPSSILDPFQGLGKYRTFLPAYVGVAGAAPDPGMPDPSDYATFNCSATMTVPAQTAKVTWNGMLPANQVNSIQSAVDGSSQVMLVAECSSPVRDGDSILQNIDGGFLGGWTRGTDSTGVGGSYRNPSSRLPTRCFNTTVVAYPVNVPTVPLTQACLASWPYRPIRSQHTGSAHVLLTDGAARNVQDGINLDILKRLASRNDSELVGDW